MQYGDTGDEVTQVQLLLRALNYDVQPTGSYDQATQDAVADWQLRLGQVATGNWDTQTTSLTNDAMTQNTVAGEALIPPKQMQGIDPGTFTAQARFNQTYNPEAWQDPDNSLDGYESLTMALEAWGLGEMIPWAIEQIQLDRSAEWIMLEMPNQQAYKDRFPAIAERRKRYPNADVLTPAQYIAFEDQANEVMRRAGLPPGFWDGPEDYYELLVNDISVEELQERIDNSYSRVADANPVVRSAFGDYFGIYGDVALATLFLDPQRADKKLDEMATQAEIAGTARQQGFTINQPLAEELQRAGFTAEIGNQLFAGAAERRDLTREQVGERTDVTEADVIRTEAGLDTATDLENRAGRRQAKTVRGGGAEETEQGLSLGRANQ